MAAITISRCRHEALGNSYKHDLVTSVVVSTEPPAGSILAADARVVLHVRE
ncbi:MAG: hypothetical protein NVSMB59_21620 [Vulcanimicrobiaceae bacterium]